MDVRDVSKHINIFIIAFGKDHLLDKNIISFFFLNKTFIADILLKYYQEVEFIGFRKTKTYRNKFLL